MLLRLAEPERPQPSFGVRDHNVIRANFWDFDRSVRVVGAATQVESDTGVISFLNRTTNPDTGGYWFFEAGVVVDSPRIVTQPAGLNLELTYRVSSEVAPEDWTRYSTEVAIRSRVMDLYVISSPIHLDIEGGLVTARHTIPFSTEASWRLSMQTQMVGDVERVQMDTHTDPIALSTEICEALSTACSVRLRCNHPQTVDAVLLRGLSTETLPR
jgi:hypothetical protein